MRTIWLTLFTISLTVSSALSQVGDAPAALYTGADVVFDGRLEKIAPSSNELTARFSITQLIKGKTGLPRPFRFKCQPRAAVTHLKRIIAT